MMPSFSKAWQFYCTKRPTKMPELADLLALEQQLPICEMYSSKFANYIPIITPLKSPAKKYSNEMMMQIECNIISP